MLFKRSGEALPAEASVETLVRQAMSAAQRGYGQVGGKGFAFHMLLVLHWAAGTERRCRRRVKCMRRAHMRIHASRAPTFHAGRASTAPASTKHAAGPTFAAKAEDFEDVIERHVGAQKGHFSQAQLLDAHARCFIHQAELFNQDQPNDGL